LKHQSCDIGNMRLLVKFALLAQALTLALFWAGYGLAVNVAVDPPTKTPQPDADQTTYHFLALCPGQPGLVDLLMKHNLSFPGGFRQSIQGCAYRYQRGYGGGDSTSWWWERWTLSWLVLSVIYAVLMIVWVSSWSPPLCAHYASGSYWNENLEYLAFATAIASPIMWLVAFVSWFGYWSSPDVERCWPNEEATVFNGALQTGAYWRLTTVAAYDFATNVVLKQCTNLVLLQRTDYSYLFLPLTSSAKVSVALATSMQTVTGLVVFVSVIWGMLLLAFTKASCEKMCGCKASAESCAACGKRTRQSCFTCGACLRRACSVMAHCLTSCCCYLCTRCPPSTQGDNAPGSVARVLPTKDTLPSAPPPPYE
jgi:hypothetical protein